MKNVIVPTNFSANADQILHYAINLANQFGSTIHLVHVHEKENPSGKSRKEILDRLEQTAQLFERELYFTTFVKTAILEGSVVNQICSYSKIVDADLIVMGGAEGWRDLGMNKNITDVIRRCRTSVLVVPNGYSYEPIKNFTLTIDKKVLTSDPEIAPFMVLAEGTNAEVKILEAAKTRILTCVEVGHESWSGNFCFQAHKINHDSINTGILEFISENKTDVLCFINREYGLSGRFLNNLITRSENHGKLIPLLLLHEKESRFPINGNLN